MYIAINNVGEYWELPNAQTREDAETWLQLRYSAEEINEYEWEIVEE